MVNQKIRADLLLRLKIWFNKRTRGDVGFLKRRIAGNSYDWQSRGIRCVDDLFFLFWLILSKQIHAAGRISAAWPCYCLPPSSHDAFSSCTGGFYDSGLNRVTMSDGLDDFVMNAKRKAKHFCFVFFTAPCFMCVFVKSLMRNQYQENKKIEFISFDYKSLQSFITARHKHTQKLMNERRHKTELF